MTGRENVGISSTNWGENPQHRKPKVSWATQIDPGSAGPKARPKGVVDGQQVNIPALPEESTQGARFRSSRVFLDTHVAPHYLSALLCTNQRMALRIPRI